MKIVIDIPEDVYKRTVFYREFRDLNDCVTTIKALEKATPLPEHHGRLIDADELKRTMEKDVRRALSFVDLTDFVWLAPTIIEGSESE